MFVIERDYCTTATSAFKGFLARILAILAIFSEVDRRRVLATTAPGDPGKFGC